MILAPGKTFALCGSLWPVLPKVRDVLGRDAASGASYMEQGMGLGEDYWCAIRC